ncbi:MAG: transcription antitermination factor NusB [Culicoidibacterales bacterium]
MRIEGRKKTIQVLYQLDILRQIQVNSTPDEEVTLGSKVIQDEMNIILNTIAQENGAVDVDYIRHSVTGVVNNQATIDSAVSEYLSAKWPFKRLGYLERAILRLGAFEILHDEMSNTVAINEAVKLAQEFCDDDAYKVINGVLDKLAKANTEQ